MTKRFSRKRGVGLSPSFNRSRLMSTFLQHSDILFLLTQDTTKRWMPQLWIFLPRFRSGASLLHEMRFPMLINFVMILITKFGRYGHGAVNPVSLRLDEDGNTIPEGNLILSRCFYDPTCWQKEGLDAIYIGMSRQRHRTVGPTKVDGKFSIFNFSFQIFLLRIYLSFWCYFRNSKFFIWAPLARRFGSCCLWYPEIKRSRNYAI